MASARADRGPQFDDGDSDRSRAAFYRQGCGRDREWRPDVALDAGSPGDRRRAVVAGRYDCGGARWSVVGHAQVYSGCQMRRNGFTLIELLVSPVIFAIDWKSVL